MAAVGSGAKTAHGTTTSTTAETWQLTDKVNQVAILNREAAAADTIYVTVATGTTAAAALAAVVTAVAEADETIAIPPLTRVVVFKSPRSTYVAGSVIGNASPVSVHGSTWFD
jgi:hypothetical protein